MGSPTSKEALVAVDLGAQSCRVSLLRWQLGAPRIEVIHRFPNGPVASGSGLRWDMQNIFEGVTAGLRRCAEAAPEGIASVGVDGWAVDYARLNGDGSLLANPFCYRDERTDKAVEKVHQLISAERLYRLTGIQILGLNTIYQLYADTLAGVDARTCWLNLPEYVTYLLGGKAVSEYTNATHTGLIELETHGWCREIFAATGLVEMAAPEVVSTGCIVGTMGAPLNSLAAFRSTRLIVPACHDTASAIAAIPAQGNDWAFISSGTWSLVGTVLDAPCVSDEARQMNFTNLGGVGGTICFLKNVNGMWLLSECMEEWERLGIPYTLAELLEQCASLAKPRVLIDVDDPQLLAPGNMLGKINAQLAVHGQENISADYKSAPRFAKVIFHSLAKRYAEVLAATETITGKKFKRLFIVGGGSKNSLLNRLTAEYSALEVIPGSSESTTIGNFAIQMAALQNEGGSSSGVSANSVAGFAETISFDSLSFSGTRQNS